MNAKPKSNSVVTATVTADGIIHIVVLGAGKLEFDPKRCAPEMRRHAEYHGWIQRLSDGAAKSRDPVTGKTASPHDKLAGIRNIADHFLGGATEWKMKGGGGGMSELILTALCNVKEVSIEIMRERIERMAEVKKTKPRTLLAALAKDKEIMAEVLRLQAERATDMGVDMEGIMEEIMESKVN